MTTDAGRVLVCDADAMSARLLARVLGGAGYAVGTCGTATECEARVRSENPDLLALAVLLPDLDGLALTRRLRASGVSTPVVVVSALPAEQRALEAGANVFLLKSVDRLHLLCLVAGLVAGLVAKRVET